MVRKDRCLCLCAILWTFFLNTAESALKSSLTFAIDDTPSMYDDIDAVKQSANAIFDTVVNSKLSQIEDFVLVSINDPDVTHIITTSDKDKYINAINSLYAHSDKNYDCPEMSISGIELALQKSRPGSLLYVFTDASAKDPEKHEAVKNLAHQKSIQVVFVLTDDCNGHGNSEVFHEIAHETSGQVFNMYKTETKTILDYILSQINSRKETLAKKQFPAGVHQFPFEVDSTMKELIIAVSGRNPTVTVTDPVGDTAAMEKNQTSNFAIVKISEVKPGTYTVEVSSDSKNSVSVTADSTVHVEHGFSTFLPSTIQETVTRPLSGEQSHISIKLANEGTNNVVLDVVQIIDLENNILAETPLSLYDDKENFYVTNATIIPPRALFRVAIKGHDTKSHEFFTRISLTPIETQKIDTSATNKKPDVAVIGETNINAEYNETLVLKCKVNGYPKPKVTWRTNNGTVLDYSTLALVEHPYDYLSTLTIDRVTSNITYQCIAKNDHGDDSQKIRVETVRKVYFNVIKKPEDAEIEIFKNSQFECEVDAYPPAEINWYKNRQAVLEDDNIKISPNKSLLIFKNMQPYMKGKYICTARNGNENRRFLFNVKISGVESPVINKTIKEYRVKDGANVKIQCPVNHGIPTPTIVWYFENPDGTEYEIEDSRDNKDIAFTNVSRNFTKIGTYLCLAHNSLGFDFHRMDLIIEYPPQINDKETTIMETKAGEKQTMDCVVDGIPKPTVKWLLNDTELILTTRHRRAYKSNGFNFYVTENDTGIYTCQATNEHGIVNKTIDLRVIKPAFIKVPENTAFIVMVGEHLELPCQADGYPKPSLKWVFHSLDPRIGPQQLRHYVPHNLSLRSVQIKDEGYYTCIANNNGGSFNISYEVKVLAPPMIKNIYPVKTFTAVIGDLVLRVPCKATGRPTPQITWLKDGVENIAAGTEWYDIEDDGTLVIKHVDKTSAGTYVCAARNSVGSYSEVYEVVVDAYPRPGAPTKTVNFVRGESKGLTCDIPHKKTDYFRWFKDGREVSYTKVHHVINAQISDAGIYTCRVSNFAKSQSANVKVVVGFKPVFLNLEKEHIDFEEGLVASMDCSAEGHPKPQVSWWHLGKRLSGTDMTYTFEMTFSKRGLYYCLLKNDHGHITRKFVIT